VVFDALGNYYGVTQNGQTSLTLLDASGELQFKETFSYTDGVLTRDGEKPFHDYSMGGLKVLDSNNDIFTIDYNNNSDNNNVTTELTFISGTPTNGSVDVAYDFSVEDVDVIVDGDMEALDCNAWSVGNEALLTKVTDSPQAGSRNLMIKASRADHAFPYAYQTTLIVGQEYTVSGYARSTSVYRAYVYNGATLLWNNEIMTAEWQSFDITFIATDEEISFRSSCDNVFGAVEFDSIGLISSSSSINPKMHYKVCSGKHYFTFNGMFDERLRNTTSTTSLDPFDILYGGDFGPASSSIIPGAFDVILYVVDQAAENIAEYKSTILSDEVLTCDELSLDVNCLIDYYINPNRNQSKLFKIISNTDNTITVEEGSKLTAVANQGQNFFVLSPMNARRYQALVNTINMFLPEGVHAFVYFLRSE